MKTRQLALPATSTALTMSLPIASLLTASSLAHAHGSGNADSGFYHYLSSPDHVIGFVAMGIVVLALAIQLLRKATMAGQRDKR